MGDKELNLKWIYIFTCEFFQSEVFRHWILKKIDKNKDFVG